MMRWIAEIKTPRNLRLMIEYDELVGYYIYIYESNNTRPTWDYLQDSLEQAKGFAFRKFQVPEDVWKVENS